MIFKSSYPATCKFSGSSGINLLQMEVTSEFCINPVSGSKTVRAWAFINKKGIENALVYR